MIEGERPLPLQLGVVVGDETERMGFERRRPENNLARHMLALGELVGIGNLVIAVARGQISRSEAQRTGHKPALMRCQAPQMAKMLI